MHSVFVQVTDPCLVFFLAILTGKCLLSFVSLGPKAEACVESVDVMFYSYSQVELDIGVNLAWRVPISTRSKHS